jgi:hypothetical protein
VADEEAADALEDAAECAERGAPAAAGSALTISRSGSRMPPAGMHNDAMAARPVDGSTSQSVDPATDGRKRKKLTQKS